VRKSRSTGSAIHFVKHKKPRVMKKASMFIAGMFFVLLSFGVNAQTKTGADYFAGKWSVLLKGLPQGDARMIFVLEKSGDKITGVVQDSTGKEISKLTNAELKEDEITVYFNAQGYDVNLMLKKKDEDHTTGSLMGMFAAEGDRIKEAGK
jgi:hypothetical protein